MCGEHLLRTRLRTPTEGSSPHVRGALPRVPVEGTFLGIIPACAGSTRSARRSQTAARDHPRMCGEHTARLPRTIPCRGSSPHVRGALVDFVNAHTHSRDHPRMCGEHSQDSSFLSSFMGSSPHVRGALQLAIMGGSFEGIIPACAGSTSSR